MKTLLLAVFVAAIVVGMSGLTLAPADLQGGVTLPTKTLPKLGTETKDYTKNTVTAQYPDGSLLKMDSVLSCSWKPDNENDGYKICNAIVEINPSSLKLMKLDESNFVLNTASKVKDTVKYFYSTTPHDYVVQNFNPNDGKFTPVTKTEWLDWKLVNGSTVSLNALSRTAVKAVFEINQYDLGHYDFGITDLDMAVDPDISACGTLTTGTYTLTQNINTATTCMVIGGNGVTLDCQGFNINQTMADYTCNGGGGTVCNVGYTGTTIKGCNITSQIDTNGINNVFSNQTTIYNTTINQTQGRDIVFSFSHNLNMSLTNMTSANFVWDVYGNFSQINISKCWFKQVGTTNPLFNTRVSPNDNVNISDSIINTTTNKYFLNNLAAGSNLNNSNIGNYWTNLTSNGFSDKCTNATDLYGNRYCTSSFTAGGVTDYIPKNETRFYFFGSAPGSTSLGLNLTVNNAWTLGDETGWDVYTDNTTYSISNVSWPNSNIILNATYAPKGFVNITIKKAGYPNTTYTNIPLNSTSLMNFTAYIVARTDMVHITVPVNTTYFSNPISLDFISPPVYGNIFAINYSVNGTTNTTGNTTSSRYNASYTSSFGANWVTTFFNTTSTMFNEKLFNATQWYTLQFSNYSVTILDEMTGGPLNITGKNVTIQVQCSNYINQIQVTSNPSQSFATSCTTNEIKLWINDSVSSQFRTLVPSSGSGTLTFYMINTTTTPAVGVLYRIMQIEDLFGNYQQGSVMTFTKAVPGVGSQIMIKQTLDASNKLLLYLIDGETYQMTITNGISTRYIGDYKASVLDTSPLIKISSINMTTDNSGKWKTITSMWNWTQPYLTFAYQDTSNATTSWTMYVYNTSNFTNPTLFTYTATGSSLTFATYTVPTNTTVRGSVCIVNTLYGSWCEDHIFIWSNGRTLELGLPADWYMPIGVFIILSIALLFSAYTAEIGSLLTLFAAGIMWYWGWLPPVFAAAITLVSLLIFMAKLRGGEHRGSNR